MSLVTFLPLTQEARVRIPSGAPLICARSLVVERLSHQCVGQLARPAFTQASLFSATHVARGDIAEDSPLIPGNPQHQSSGTIVMT